MTCYGWERGEFVFSTVEFRRFRNEFVAALNKMRADDLFAAEEFYIRLLEKKKAAPRGTPWKTLFDELLSETVAQIRYGYRHQVPRFNFQNLSEWRLERLLFLRETKNEAGQIVLDTSGPPMKPKKKDFAPLVASKFEFIELEGSEGSVSFEPSKRKVIWNVTENNHAVERAREHKLGALFFSMLAQVKWTRGTGGSVVGNDEYNRENRSAGGASNQLKETFGPLGEQEHEDRYCGIRESVRRAMGKSRHR